MSGRTVRVFGRCFFVVSLMFGLSACGAGNPASITGKVTYAGKPVLMGSVVFVCSDRQQRSAMIEADGTFRILDAVSGEAKAAVESPKPEPPPPASSRGIDRDRGGAPRRAPPVNELSKWFAIPEKYARVDTSGLVYKLSRGSNDITIELKE